MDRVLSQFDDVAEVPTGTPDATAWIARERDSERDVLIKKLPDASVKTRATQALALDHPRILKTRRWMRDEDAFYVVRDYVAGRNLRAAIPASSHRGYDKLRETLDPILDALDYAHQAGLTHGGVTPENVLVDTSGTAFLGDFATARPRNGDRRRYAPTILLDRDGGPTPRLDYYGLCELYKEFLPERAEDDEAGMAARARLLRNLTEIQLTSASIDELRYKLDAVAKMAELLGFTDAPNAKRAPLGARLVCFVTPSSVTVNAGGGTTIMLTVYNEGDAPLRIEAIGSDAVWLNYHSRFSPFTLPPDTERDLPFKLSAARLTPGSHKANLLIRSNSGMQSLEPPKGIPWNEQIVALPVLSRGPTDTGTPPQFPDKPINMPGPLAPRNPPASLRVSLSDRLPSAARPPLAESLPPAGPAPPLAENLPPAQERTIPSPKQPVETAVPAVLLDQPAIACTQEPDPAVVRQGQSGVLHLGVRNISRMRLRIDKMKITHPWLMYPGDFRPIWIEPGASHFLGFSVMASALPTGNHRGEITFKTSGDQPAEMGLDIIWREMKCDVRVLVVPGGENAAKNTGCTPVLLVMGSLLGMLGLLAVSWR